MSLIHVCRVFTSDYMGAGVPISFSQAILDATQKRLWEEICLLTKTCCWVACACLLNWTLSGCTARCKAQLDFPLNSKLFVEKYLGVACSTSEAQSHSDTVAKGFKIVS